MSKSFTVQSLGAAGTVTGSKHLVRAGRRRVLLDCGLFQGLKVLRERNWQEPPFDPRTLDAIVLSHAHIDHSGQLPLVARRGFHGPVFCTAATADLLEIMLRDAAHLQEEEAERANRYGYTRHRPALPLYTRDDVEAALGLLQVRPYRSPFPVTDGITACFRHAGHILGSATVELSLGHRTPRIVAFSGDLGRRDRPILKDPETIPEADLLLLESTYGDRVHPDDSADQLARVVREAAARGGALLVPAFAVGRTQELVWLIRQLEDDGRIPALPVYVDSPMAVDVTAIYLRHREEHDLDMRILANDGRNALRSRQLTLVRSAVQSKGLNDVNGPIIIIAASGMATGGRILHHLRLRLPDPRTTVLFTGFQAAGTRGRALLDGTRSVRIFGEEVPVRARTERIDGLSAHADRDELLKWLAGFGRPPSRTRLVHGEPQAADCLRAAIEHRLGWPVRVANETEVVTP